MPFGERLTELRIKNGFTKRNEFADKLGIPSTTLRNYETNMREPGHKFLKQISELFNVSVDYLLCLTDEHKVLNSFCLKSTEYNHIEKYRSLDDHGKDIVDTILDKEYHYSIAANDANTIENKTAVKQSNFTISIQGDSMEPLYQDGDVVLVQAQPTVEIGEIGIFILNGTSYLKKAGTNGLISLNPKYPVIPISDSDNVYCVGKVIDKTELAASQIWR